MSYQAFPTALLLQSPRLTRTGDPGASVAGINTTQLGDGSIVYCQENKREYQLDKTSGATPDGNAVIQPIAGPGRWLFFTGGGTPFDSLSGSVSVPADSNVELGPFTREAGQRLQLLLYVPEDIDITWGGSFSVIKGTFKHAAASGVNNFSLVIENNDVGSAHTVEWLIMAVAPPA